MPLVELVPDRSWPTLGWEVIDWIETYLCHGPGDVEGEPIVLDEEFCQVICDLYRLYPKGHAREGQRVCRYFELSRAKGRAKSELAGMIVCVEFVGPSRFSHWDDDGQPVGKQVRYPFIRCLATEEGQTGNTYDNVQVMLRHAQEHHSERYEAFRLIDVGLTRTFYKGSGGGEIRPSSAASSSKDGGKESFCVADEVHLYNTTELRSMHKTVRRNSVKRKDARGWMLATTTQYAPGEDSVAEANAKEAADLAEHPAKRARRLGFCRSHRQGTPVEQWSDDKAVLASLAEAYGPAAEWMDLESILSDEIRAGDSTEQESRRYWLNMAAGHAERAVDPLVWDEMAAPMRTPSSGEVVLCFDGSKLDETSAKTPDATALLAWTVEDVPHLFTLGVWQPNSGDQRKLRREVRAAVAEAKETFTVRRLVGDRAHWESQLDDWADEFGQDANGDDIVIVFDTNQPQRMGRAIDRFAKEGVPNRAFTHDGDPVLRRHVLNMVLTKAKRSDYSAVGKPGYGADDKIDAGVTAIIGYEELPNVEPAEPAAEPFVWVLGG